MVKNEGDMIDTRNTVRLLNMLLVFTALLALIISVNGQEVTVTNTNSEGAGTYKTELTSGSWVLSGIEQKTYNGTTLTKWNTGVNEVNALLSWKDILDIIHTVNSEFKWQEPPQSMRPGSYLDLEAVYNNLDYATPSNIKTGIKIFIDRVNATYLSNNPDAIEVLKVTKDNKQYQNEIKKGFFVAPKTLFDESNECQLIVDCYIGKDHYVTIYKYTYQP